MTEPTDLTSPENPLLVRVRRLHRDPSSYRRVGQCWAAGEHLGQAALARGQVPAVAVVAKSAWSRCAHLAAQAQRAVRVPDRLMALLGDLDSPPPVGFLMDWTPRTEVLPAVGTLVLDRLQDAGNVGTILRSAAAFGLAQVVALKGTAALWSPKVLRAGMGAHFGLHLVEGADAGLLDALQVPLLATSSHAGESIIDVRLPSPCAWVVGHEGQGVHPDVVARCEQVLRIPQPGGEESLNVAAATAVCLYEGWRQREARGRIGG